MGKTVKPMTPFKRLTKATHEVLKAITLEENDNRKREEKFEPKAPTLERSIDHWFTNTNYYEMRFHEAILECLKPDAGADVQEAAREALRTFAKKRDVRIERYSCEELRDDFFPDEMAIPITFKDGKTYRRPGKNHRDQLGAKRDVVESLTNFWESYKAYIDEDKFRALKYVGNKKEIPEDEKGAIDREIEFYEALRKRFAKTPFVAYQMLLPIWIVKDVSPLFSEILPKKLVKGVKPEMILDAKKMHAIAQAVCEGFLESNVETLNGLYVGEDDCDDYLFWVDALVNDLLACHPDDPKKSAYAQMSIPELFEELYGDRVDPLYEHIGPKFPRYAICEAKLLWTLIGGSIFGFAVAVKKPQNGTPLVIPGNRFAGFPDDALVEGRGKALFCRVEGWGKDEPASTDFIFGVNLGSEGSKVRPAEGLVAVIGREYKLPYEKITVRFSEHERKQKPKLFEMAQAAGSEKPPIEFITGMQHDSPWHLGVFLEGEPLQLYLVDLGSQNGTYVIRRTAEGKRAFAFKGRNAELDKARVKMDMDELGIYEMPIVKGFVEARRGDLIMLGTSTFKIL